MKRSIASSSSRFVISDKQARTRAYSYSLIVGNDPLADPENLPSDFIINTKVDNDQIYRTVPMTESGISRRQPGPIVNSMLTLSVPEISVDIDSTDIAGMTHSMAQTQALKNNVAYAKNLFMTMIWWGTRKVTLGGIPIFYVQVGVSLVPSWYIQDVTNAKREVNLHGGLSTSNIMLDYLTPSIYQYGSTTQPIDLCGYYLTTQPPSDELMQAFLNNTLTNNNNGMGVVLNNSSSTLVNPVDVLETLDYLHSIKAAHLDSVDHSKWKITPNEIGGLDLIDFCTVMTSCCGNAINTLYSDLTFTSNPTNGRFGFILTTIGEQTKSGGQVEKNGGDGPKPEYPIPCSPTYFLPTYILMDEYQFDNRSGASQVPRISLPTIFNGRSSFNTVAFLSQGIRGNAILMRDRQIPTNPTGISMPNSFYSYGIIWEYCGLRITTTNNADVLFGDNIYQAYRPTNLPALGPYDTTISQFIAQTISNMPSSMFSNYFDGGVGSVTIATVDLSRIGKFPKSRWVDVFDTRYPNIAITDTEFKFTQNGYRRQLDDNLTRVITNDIAKSLFLTVWEASSSQLNDQPNSFTDYYQINVEQGGVCDTKARPIENILRGNPNELKLHITLQNQHGDYYPSANVNSNTILRLIISGYPHNISTT